MPTASDPVSDALRMIPVLVDEIVAEADNVISLVLTGARGTELPRWEPGAHVDVILSDELTRPYSLCGDPDDHDKWRVAVLREPQGRGGSEWVHTHVQVGDELLVRGVRNNFPLIRADGYLFIAGGIGITPLLPMIQRAAAGDAPWKLHYGGRRRRSMGFVAWLEQFGDAVEIWPEDECGLLDLAGLLGTPQPGVAVYCCGPEPLLTAVEERCANWPTGALHLERFRAKPLAAAQVDTVFEVVAARSGVTTTVQENQSIVEALSDAGVDIPTACGEGTCETCITRVLEGIPEHRDDLLTDEQREAGDFLPCCARALSPRLVLDV